MTVVSVIGAPGVGKSFLVKHLACLECLPSFYEGEPGIFTEDVLSVLNAEEDSEERYRWMLDRYEQNLRRAKEISDNGIDCYVDGGVLTVEAWLHAEQGDKSPPTLREWLREHEHLKADKVVVLTMEEDKLENNMRERGRESEQNEFIIQRSLRIQRGSITVGQNHDQAFIFDRTGVDFEEPSTLRAMRDRIRAFSP